MLVWKEVIRPGITWYSDRETGLPRKLVVTPEGVKYFFETGQKMLAAGLSVPVPLEHQPDAKPLTAHEKAARQLLNNTGWVQKYEVKDDRLHALLDIQDEEVVKKLPKTIRWTSPYIDSFMDGNGTAWNGVISHVALTSRPRIIGQTPFPTVAAAMSFATTLHDAPLTPTAVAPGHGFYLSRAGLLEKTGDTFQPAYPVAFSLWSGVALASDLLDPEAKPRHKKPAEAIAEKPAVDKTPPPVPEVSSTPPLPGGAPGMPPAPEMPLVDADGDISVITVICDLLESVGVPIPEGTTKDNFYERLYEAAMEKVKTGAGPRPPEVPPMNDRSNQPPGGKNPNDLPRNPTIPEAPPLYMSLEQVNAIADPTLKQMATIALSLRNNAIESAKARRMERIERLCKRVRQAGFQDKLVAQAQSCQLSLTSDGKVNDPMSPTLDLLEQGIKDLPSLLTSTVAQLSEMPHPRDPDSTMSEERRQEIVKEFCRNSHLPEPTANGVAK